MTQLERDLYVALLGARTIVSATANVNPAAHKILRLMDSAAEKYRKAKGRDTPEAITQDEESADASGN